jgi:hypothetical protein
MWTRLWPFCPTEEKQQVLVELPVEEAALLLLRRFGVDCLGYPEWETTDNLHDLGVMGYPRNHPFSRPADLGDQSVLVIRRGEIRDEEIVPPNEHEEFVIDDALIGPDIDDEEDEDDDEDDEDDEEDEDDWLFGDLDDDDYYHRDEGWLGQAYGW